MARSVSTPGEVEVYGAFSRHLGPRFASAGLGIQFHYNQEPGIYFKVDVPAQFRDAIMRGLQEAMAIRFPGFPASASLWITRVDVHDVDSSSNAFYQAARMVVEQAYLLSRPFDAS